MARYAHARNSFLLGEVSPSLLGRADNSEQYRQMCEKILNMCVRPHGGATFRGGTQGLQPLYNNASFNTKAMDKIKSVPYVYTDANGNKIAGFILLTSTTIKYYSLTTQAVVTVNTVSGGGTFGTDWLLYQTGNEDTGETQWAQYGNFLVILDPGGSSYPLVVYFDGVQINYFVWGLVEIATDGSVLANSQDRLVPYDIENVTAVTMSISTAAIGTGRTLTASAPTFTAAMIGRRIRVRSGSTVGVARITAYTSTTVVTAAVERAFAGTGAYPAWSFSQWGGDRGFPRTVAFFEDRLFFANCLAFTNRGWGSQIADLYEFSNPDPTATLNLADAFQVNVGQSGAGDISHLFPREKLFSNTQLREAYLDSIDETISIGFGNTKITSNSFNGAAHCQPVGVKNGLIFIGAIKSKLKELIFINIYKTFEVTDLSYFAPDIVRDRARIDLGVYDSVSNWDPGRLGLKMLAFTRNPFPILWAIDNTGKLYSCTRDLDNKVLAWSHHTLGGSVGSAEPQVIDICSVLVNNSDVLVLTVRRDIGGVTRTCFETLAMNFIARKLFDPTYVTSGLTGMNSSGIGAQETMESSVPIFLDYAVVKANHTASTSITGLAHLASQQVSVVADGIYVGESTISAGGVLTLATAAKSVVIGFKYIGELIPSALESNALFGSGLGTIKRTEETIVEFERTCSAKLGVSSSDTSLKAIDFRPASIPSTDPIPLFSGEQIWLPMANYDRKQNIKIQQYMPYPMTVNAIIAKGLLYD